MIAEHLTHKAQRQVFESQQQGALCGGEPGLIALVNSAELTHSLRSCPSGVATELHLSSVPITSAMCEVYPYRQTSPETSLTPHPTHAELPSSVGSHTGISSSSLLLLRLSWLRHFSPGLL